MVYLVLIPVASSPTHPSSQGPSVEEDPGIDAWDPTGEYRTEQSGIGLTVHSYRIGWDYIAVLYSVHSIPGLSASPATVTLTDDSGQTYSISNTILGTSLGVTAALLTTEPYKGRGSALTLAVTDMSISTGDAASSQTVPGTWSVTFIENQVPGAPMDYIQGGRISPEVMSAGDLTMAVAGQPGGRFIKLLIDRTGQQSALYGLVSDGAARPLTETEFHQLLLAQPGRVDDFPPPPDWPAPAPAP